MVELRCQYPAISIARLDAPFTIRDASSRSAFAWTSSAARALFSSAVTRPSSSAVYAHCSRSSILLRPRESRGVRAVIRSSLCASRMRSNCFSMVAARFLISREVAAASVQKKASVRQSSKNLCIDQVALAGEFTMRR